MLSEVGGLYPAAKLRHGSEIGSSDGIATASAVKLWASHHPLATRQGLLHLSTQTLLPPHHPWLSHVRQRPHRVLRSHQRRDPSTLRMPLDRPRTHPHGGRTTGPGDTVAANSHNSPCQPTIPSRECCSPTLQSTATCTCAAARGSGMCNMAITLSSYGSGGGQSPSRARTSSPADLRFFGSEKKKRGTPFWPASGSLPSGTN